MSSKDRSDEKRIEPNVAAESISFEGIREVVAQVEPPVTGQRAPASGVDVLDQIRIACQPGGEIHSGTECRRCARFVNWVPSVDRTRVTVRCLWRESDRVGDLMAYVSALPAVREEAALGEAVAAAGRAGVSHLIVVGDGGFRGILDVQDAPAGPALMVRDRMMQPAWSVSADASLGDLVRVMNAHATDVVPVLASGKLLGVITRAALCDAGLAAAFERATDGA